MRTPEEIKGRCRIVDGDDGKEHWIWTGAVDRREGTGVAVVRAPDYGRDPTGQKTWVMTVRRALYMVTKKKAPKPGLQFFQTCQVIGCVSPNCTSLLTKKRGGTHVSARIRANPETQRKLSEAAHRTWDKRGRKVSDETVQEIILSEKTNMELAAEYGLAHDTVWGYRTGRTRQAAKRQAMGMFSGLVR